MQISANKGEEYSRVGQPRYFHDHDGKKELYNFKVGEAIYKARVIKDIKIGC